MRRRLAVGDVTDRVAQRRELVDFLVDLVCPSMQQIAWQVGPAIPAEHAGNFLQRGNGHLAIVISLICSSTSGENCRRSPCRNGDSINPISS